MKKKNIFTGNYDPLTEKDYPWLREHFLNVFIKGTYKKKSFLEGEWSPITGGGMTQPRVRGRFLAEETYHGKYQPNSFHKAIVDHRYDFIVIGRYYTENLGYKHYKVRVIVMSGTKKGRIGFVTVG